MSERRDGRGVGRRRDAEILDHPSDMHLLGRVERGEVAMSPDIRMELRRLVRDDLIFAAFGRANQPVLLPRGQRLLAVARGEVPTPVDERCPGRLARKHPTWVRCAGSVPMIEWAVQGDVAGRLPDIEWDGPVKRLIFVLVAALAGLTLLGCTPARRKDHVRDQTDVGPTQDGCPASQRT